MASTTFVDGETLIEAAWLNDVNAVVYTPGTSTAADIANVPAGNIAATDVQTALNELDTEKQPLDALLTSLAVQTTAADRIQGYSGVDTAMLYTVGTATDNVPLIGTKSATKILPGLNYDIPQIQPVSASVAINVLTLGLDPTTLDFRSATLTSGTVNIRNLATAISLVVPDTATLGTVNAVSARLAMLAIDNAGTVELAVVNLAGGNNLDETTLISTTAISAGADSNNVIYSTTARTNVPFRVVGFIDITEATAGTWATAPTLVQGAGGNAATSMSSLGSGQTWQDVKASRASGVTYYNTTGKAIMVMVVVYNPSAYATCVCYVNGVIIGTSNSANAANFNVSMTFIVPVGSSYSVTGAAIGYWSELRNG